LGDLASLDLNAGQAVWTTLTLPGAPRARARHSMVTAGSRIWVFGVSFQDVAERCPVVSHVQSRIVLFFYIIFAQSRSFELTLPIISNGWPYSSFYRAMLRGGVWRGVSGPFTHLPKNGCLLVACQGSPHLDTRTQQQLGETRCTYLEGAGRLRPYLTCTFWIARRRFHLGPSSPQRGVLERESATPWWRQEVFCG